MSTDELWRGEAPPDLASVIRRVRKSVGISMRELARRCGVSAGQLSRIESGDVGQPEIETVRSVAQALGVPTVPLLVISGHLGQQDLEQFVDEREGLFDTEDLGFIIRGETSNLEHDRTLGPLDAASIIIERWNPRALSRELGLDEDPAQHQVDEVAAAWPGLTEDRRRMVLAFVADQEVLSRLERMPNPPGRYLPSVTLNPTAADDA